MHTNNVIVVLQHAFVLANICKNTDPQRWSLRLAQLQLRSVKGYYMAAGNLFNHQLLMKYIIMAVMLSAEFPKLACALWRLIFIKSSDTF